MIRFEENEYILIAMFQKGSRQATIDKINSVIPYVDKEEEMLMLINSTLEKLRSLSDKAFQSIDLEPYQQEPVEDE